MREFADLAATPPSLEASKAALHLEKNTMDAERINALGSLIEDLRARTAALRGYL